MGVNISFCVAQESCVWQPFSESLQTGEIQIRHCTCVWFLLWTGCDKLFFFYFSSTSHFSWPINEFLYQYVPVCVILDCRCCSPFHSHTGAFSLTHLCWSWWPPLSLCRLSPPLPLFPIIAFLLIPSFISLSVTCSSLPLSPSLWLSLSSKIGNA